MPLEQPTLPVPTAPEEGSRWRHFKGGLYTVLKIARHSEDKNHFFVVYQNDDTSEVWIRDLWSFLAINDDGTPRFARR